MSPSEHTSVSVQCYIKSFSIQTLESEQLYRAAGRKQTPTDGMSPFQDFAQDLQLEPTQPMLIKMRK